MCIMSNVSLVWTIFFKTKLEMLMKKRAFYFLGEATRSDAEQQIESSGEEKPHGSLHDLSEDNVCVVHTVYYGVYSV